MGRNIDSIHRPVAKKPETKKPAAVPKAEPKKQEYAVTAYRRQQKKISNKYVLGGLFFVVPATIGVLIFAGTTAGNYYGQRSIKYDKGPLVIENEPPVYKEPVILVDTNFQRLDPVGQDRIIAEQIRRQEAYIAMRIANQVVQRGVYQDVYHKAAKKFGVPWQILAAVHYVETGQRGDTTIESGAGAKGPMQFLEGTFDHYAIDGDGDGIKSIYDVHDSIFSAANMLAQNGAAKGRIVTALYQYNHSYYYVSKVLAIADSYGD